MEANEIEYDDLTKISGIGDTRQQWLIQSFGVRNYDDLAALSADDIETQLKADNKPYSRSEIELWPQEAAELAETKSQSSHHSNVEPSASETGNSPTKETRLEGVQNTQVGQWKPVATFIVEFQVRRTKNQIIEQQTKVNYHDTDQEIVLPGIESQQICRWMVEQADNKLHQEIKAPSAVKPKTKTVGETALPGRLAITTTNLRLSQPAGTEITLALKKNGQPYAGSVRAGLPFNVETDFDLGEHAGEAIGPRQIPYQAQLYAQNHSTGDKVYLGDTKPDLLVGNKPSYSAIVSGVTLTPGTYRLQVVVIPESKNMHPGYFELPRLRVE
jgi:hypothetical protein